MTWFPIESLDSFTLSDYQILARRSRLRAILAVSDWSWGPRLLALTSVTAPVNKTIPQHALVQDHLGGYGHLLHSWISSWILDTWFTHGYSMYGYLLDI